MSPWFPTPLVEILVTKIDLVWIRKFLSFASSPRNFDMTSDVCYEIDTVSFIFIKKL